MPETPDALVTDAMQTLGAVFAVLVARAEAADAVVAAARAVDARFEFDYVCPDPLCAACAEMRAMRAALAEYDTLMEAL